MRRIPCLLFLLAIGCGGQHGGAVRQDGDHIVITCQETARLEVRVRCRLRASAAERDWLQLEFDNRTEAALPVTQVAWRIDWADLHDPSGKHLGTSSGLARGALGDLVPELVGGKPWLLPPGVTRVAAPVSDQATALLGVATAPVRVTPHAVAHAVVGDEEPRAMVEKGPTFTFLWLPPDADGLRRMRATLAELVRTERPTMGSRYLVRVLLDHPAVGGTWSLDDLLALFVPAPDSATHWVWNAVLPVLETRFADAPALAEWLLRRLRGDDVTIVADLQMMDRVWRADFLPELLRRYTATPDEQQRVLDLLERRGAPHRDDVAACAVLAAPWADQLAALPPNVVATLVSGGGERRPLQAAQCVRAVGLSRACDRLATLAPWLGVRARMYPGCISLVGTMPPQAERVCDEACDAVLRLLGDDPAAAWQQQLGAFPDPMSQTTEGIRDRQIAALQQRLRDRGIATTPR